MTAITSVIRGEEPTFWHKIFKVMELQSTKKTFYYATIVLPIVTICFTGG